MAADARKIADEIETRLIEAHMGDAAERLSRQNVPEGHARAAEAATDMKGMIQFCQAAGGGAGAACRFKLEIKMGMNLGNTLGQLTAGRTPGASGLPGLGSSGPGGSGPAGSTSQFGVFGPEQFDDKTHSQSRVLSERQARSDSAAEQPGEAAGNVDAVNAAKKLDAAFEATGGARVLEEYRTAIDSYFKRLAEEDAVP